MAVMSPLKEIVIDRRRFFFFWKSSLEGSTFGGGVSLNCMHFELLTRLPHWLSFAICLVDNGHKI